MASPAAGRWDGLHTTSRAAGPQVRWTVLFVVLLILVLAEIWRFGIRLQEDVEATV